MKIKLILAPLALVAMLGSASAASFITAGNLSAIKTPFDGVVGVRFGVGGVGVPGPSDYVEVTKLGFYAGITGAFTGAGVVDVDHTITISGPNTYNNRAGAYTGLTVASATVTAGSAVDANGWAWVDLAAPLALVEGSYYSLLTTLSTAGQGSNDPYFDPTGSTLVASAFAQGSGYNDDTWLKGRYGLGSGAEYYGSDGYLGANFQFNVVPEPTAALLGGLGLLGLLRRRR